jgi:hypothetical protein
MENLLAATKKYYSERLTISRGKKAPVSVELVDGVVRVTTGEGRIHALPVEGLKPYMN